MRTALEWDHHFMGRLQCPRPTGYARHGRASKMLSRLLTGPARDVADPEPGFKAATLIEAMYARVLSAALHEDVVTIPGPGFREGCANDGASVALTLKFRMRDNILEEGVPP